MKRSTTYATDIAKSINAPIIHVNGDNPEAVALATIQALEYQQKFKKDVVVDILGYRYWGHNELDEPAFTQPKMYSIIKTRQTIATKYHSKISSIFSEQDKKKVQEEYFALLDQALSKAEGYQPQSHSLQSSKTWKSLQKSSTGVPMKDLCEIGKLSVTTPDNFVMNYLIEENTSSIGKISCGIKT